MFAEIKTNGAHTIVIAIPREGADKTLPALARMLENNAVFFSSPSWRDNNIVQPNMTIHLGDSYQFENRDEKFLVQLQDCAAIISEDWQAATPNVLVSNREAIDKLEKRLEERNNQVQLLKLQLDEANEKLQAMQAEQEDDG
jgi:hypothetical protein